MINDLKFLYYIFSNYTLEEIKTLNKTVQLLPYILLKNFQELNN